jgi:hypothetical protein
MGIKASEGFLDLIAITDSATGLLKTGLAPTCTLYKISDGTTTSLTVAEIGTTGLYKVTNLTFGTATEYVTVWAVAGAYTIHYPFKLFKVGGGQEADLYTDTQALVGRLTAARAGYLDELGAANLPADLDTVLTRLTAARAGYLDELAAANIPADVDTLLTRLSALRAGYLDNLSAGAVALNADMATILTRLSAARAGYLDNLSAGAVALASVCTEARLGELAAANIPADIDTLGTRLSAARAGYLDNLSAGAVALASVCTDVRLAELAAANLPTDIDTLLTRLSAVRGGYLDNINNANLASIVVASSKVNSQVKGIDDIDFPATQKTSLETAVDLGLDNALGSPTANSLAERVKSLDDNYTATRAPYLDKLANHQISKIFFSTLDDVIDLSATAADVNLPDVILPNITGTIDMVYVGIIVNELENTSASGANGINVAQNIRIKKSTGAWGTDDIAAINLKDNQWMVPASTAGLSRFQGGDINVASEVDAFNATYNLRFEDADVDYDYLRLKDVQVFLMVYYH